MLNLCTNQPRSRNLSRLARLDRHTARVDWRDLARAQAGVITRGQLTDCGVGASVIRRLIARRDLVPVLPGVYAARPSPVSFELRAWAGVLWSGGVLSHRSAARLWGLPAPSSTSIHLTVAPAVRPTAAGFVLHRVVLVPGSITTIDDLPVTRRPATVVDLLRCEPLPAARKLLGLRCRVGPRSLMWPSRRTAWQLRSMVVATTMRTRRHLKATAPDRTSCRPAVGGFCASRGRRCAMIPPA